MDAIDGDLENDGSDGGSAGDVEEEGGGDALDSDSNCGAAGNFLADETATLRTLIAAWLQTGDICNAMHVFSSHGSLLRQFYRPHAFLRCEALAPEFFLRLKVLDGVDVYVDTMTVLSLAGLGAGGPPAPDPRPRPPRPRLPPPTPRWP